jgi:2-dehydropantoate 2-reductase
VRLRGQPELTLPSAGGPAAAVLADAGWRVSVTDDFVTAAWHKLLTNAGNRITPLTTPHPFRG